MFFVQKSYWSLKEKITRQSDLFDDLFDVYKLVPPRKRMIAITSHYQILVADMKVDSKAEEEIIIKVVW